MVCNNVALFLDPSQTNVDKKRRKQDTSTSQRTAKKQKKGINIMIVGCTLSWYEAAAVLPIS